MLDASGLPNRRDYGKAEAQKLLTENVIREPPNMRVMGALFFLRS